MPLLRFLAFNKQSQITPSRQSPDISYPAPSGGMGKKNPSTPRNIEGWMEQHTFTTNNRF